MLGKLIKEPTPIGLYMSALMDFGRGEINLNQVYDFKKLNSYYVYNDSFFLPEWIDFNYDKNYDKKEHNYFLVMEEDITTNDLNTVKEKCIKIANSNIGKKVHIVKLISTCSVSTITETKWEGRQ